MYGMGIPNSRESGAAAFDAHSRLGCFQDSSRGRLNILCSQATMFAEGFVEGLKRWKQQQAVVLSACELQTAGKASHSADLSEATDLSGDHTLNCKGPHEA